MITIENMTNSDWSDVKRIYQQGLDSGISTFQTEVPSFEEWNEKHVPSCRLVAKIKDQVVGWAALTKVSHRCVYEGVAEVSIYMDSDFQGQGIGSKLLTALIKESEQNGFWTLQSTILTENVASIELHTKCGFNIIGIRSKIGKGKDGFWKDVVIVEKRSGVVGID